MVLGHEGAGVVEAVGPDVAGISVGDHVVLSAIGRCGRCAACIDGRSWLCSTWGATIFSGTLPGGATRLRLRGAPVYHWFAQSSFAERVVVPEGAVVPVRKDVSLEKVALLACGVSTGLGAVFNAAGVKVGESVVVIGCGGVGVSAIVGAALAHAYPVVAVDIPSGADPDAATAESSIAPSSAVVTFTAPRLVHVLANASAGPTVVAQIGTPEAVILSSLNMHAITAADIKPIAHLYKINSRAQLTIESLFFAHALLCLLDQRFSIPNS